MSLLSGLTSYLARLGWARGAGLFARGRDQKLRPALNGRGPRKATKPVVHHFTHDLPKRFRIRRNNLHLKVGSDWRKPNTRHPYGSGRRLRRD